MKDQSHQSEHPSLHILWNQNPTQNNGLVDSDGNPVNDSGIANNQTGGQAGNTGSTKNDGSQQTTLEGSTPSTMANVTFSATKYVGTGVPTGVTDPSFTDTTSVAPFRIDSCKSTKSCKSTQSK